MIADGTIRPERPDDLLAISEVVAAAFDGSSVVREKLAVLDRHCETEDRDPSTIERTIVSAGDPVEDEDAFLASMEQYARLGIEGVSLSPRGPDPTAWVERVCARVVPRLRDL